MMADDKIYAEFDDSGFATGFWHSAAYGPDFTPPDGAIEITDDHFTELFENQGLRKWDSATSTVVTYTPPAPVPTEADYSTAILAMLDAKAKERQYDSINTAISYRDDPNVEFAAEGKAFFDWRSSVWTYATAQLAAVKAGTRAQPSVADFVTEIEGKCSFSWPAEAAA